MKPVRALAIVVYNVLAKRMPESNTRFHFGAGKLRAWCAGHMLAACGRDVNVERMAAFGRGVSLGDRSGLGIRASVGEETRIGSDVMMGQEPLRKFLRGLR